MSRKTAREKAMQLIYQMNINEASAEETLKDLYEQDEEELPAEEKEYIDDCIKGVEKNLGTIDSYIEKNLRNWKINRISKVELSILRLSIYEMLQREDVPNIVSVNEAIELSKQYGGDNSSAFVNGILGKVIKEIQ